MNIKKCLWLAMCLCSLVVQAAEMPATSTADSPAWYFIRFMNGGAVLQGQEDGANVRTASMDGSDAQMWRLEGSQTAGYRLVNRAGQQLYTTSTEKNGMFRAASSPSGSSTFAIARCTLSGYTEGFTLAPKGNTGVYMNQWGGAGTGKELGLWGPVDANCPLTFVSEAEYQDQLRLASIPLIPMPQDIQLQQGTATLAQYTTIAYCDETQAELAQQFAPLLERASGHTLHTTATTVALPQAGTITLVIDPAVTGEEAYTMTMQQDASVVIRASQGHGLFNGLQTLRQLFYDARFNGEGQVQLVNIQDRPLFGYRGFMLDIARHYFDKEDVKRLLDIMAMYKVSKFHWHLTDDQGWRIEIPEYPRLTQVGAIRQGSNTKTSPRFYDDTEYGRGMYYTLDDLREVVDYASRLHIDIIPEVDLPGHMVAAIASYPDELSCNPRQPLEGNTYQVRINEGISKDVLNVAKPEVMDFLRCVLAHMCQVFPYPIIHIGGDECPTQAWQARVDAGDTQFTQWMTEKGLKNVNEIQPWLVNELGIWLKQEYGKDVVCWNELTNHWNTTLQTQPIIMCYSDYGQNAMRAATNLGLRTIYTGCWPFYLDMYQTYDGGHQFDEPYTGGYGNNTLQRVYEATPLSNIGGKEQLCLGVGANLWTETVNNVREADHQYFPRMLALAEVGWLPQNQKSWPSFRQRVQTHFRILDEYGVNYATYDLDQPQLSAYEAACAEARRLLADDSAGHVGYPSQDAYDALLTALQQSTEQGTLALEAAIEAYKNAPLTMPQPGHVYRIVSASVAWGRDYAGSAMYLTQDNQWRFHYTQQTEPEELFEFEATTNGKKWNLKSRLGGMYVDLGGTIDQKVKSHATTPSVGIRLDAARHASTSPAYYDYLPGVLHLTAYTISYSPNSTTLRRLNAQNDGYVYLKGDPTVGHTGCWRIQEVTDFAAELRALVAKCSRLGILADEVVTPATAELEASPTISRDTYERYAALYAQHIGRTFQPVETSIAPIAQAFPQGDGRAYHLSGRPYTGGRGIYVSQGRKYLSK